MQVQLLDSAELLNVPSRVCVFVCAGVRVQVLSTVKAGRKYVVKERE